MRHATHRLTLGLLGAFALTALVRAEDLPLSSNLVERLPARYRVKAKTVRLSPEAQKYYATAPDGQLFEAVTDVLSARLEGLAFLVASGDLEKDGPRRASDQSRGCVATCSREVWPYEIAVRVTVFVLLGSVDVRSSRTFSWTGKSHVASGMQYHSWWTTPTGLCGWRDTKLTRLFG